MNSMNPQRTQGRRHAPVERPATYEAPAILFEMDLEVRAGSPLGLPDPLNSPGTKW